MSRDPADRDDDGARTAGQKVIDGLDSNAASIPDPLVERTIRLFTFLGQSQQGPGTVDPGGPPLGVYRVPREIGWADTPALYRSTIDWYGFGQLGSAIRTRLEAIALLVVRGDP